MQVGGARHRARAAALGAVLSLLPSGSSHTFGLKRSSTGAQVSWRHGVVEVEVVREADRGDVGRLLSAARSAAATWTKAANLVIEVVEVRPGAVSTSASNTVLLSWSKDTYRHEPGALAVTLLTYARETGEVQHGAILVNDVTFEWNTTRDGELSGYDLQSVLTHEFGHALGLGHSDVTGATMFAHTGTDETGLRSLHKDDIAGVQHLYGAPSNGAGPSR